MGMTIEETIKGLQAVNEHIGKHFNEGGAWMAEFIDNAIKALNQQPNRCDRCTHSEEQDGSNCYECVKGIADNFETQPTDVDCISRAELLARIDAERKHLLDLKMDGAEHIIVHHARRIIEDMPSITYKAESEEDVCKDCYYNDGEVHAECVICDKAESEE